jgi:hypothetical protein
VDVVPLEVREAGEPIIDPASGDVLGYTGERTLGRLRVVSVADRYAVAAIVGGSDFRVGLSCTRVVTASTPPHP